MSAGNEREFIGFQQSKGGKLVKCPRLKSRYTIQQSIPEEGTHSISPKFDYSIIDNRVEVTEFQDCISKECAWWDEIGQCCIKSASEYLAGIAIAFLPDEEEEDDN